MSSFFLKSYLVWIVLLFQCDSKVNKNIYEGDELLRNIEDVLLTVLIEDGNILENDDVYIITPIQPYILESDTEYVVTYNSFSKYHFPNLEEKFRKVGYEISQDDVTFIRKQKQDSKPIGVDLHPFNSRLWREDIYGQLLYYNFSIPLFNQQMDLAWLFYRYRAGSQFGCEAVLQKQKGLWKIINIEHL